MLKRISKLENHFIIAGCGSTGMHVLKEMYQTGANFVVIEGDGEKMHELEERFNGIHYIVGDATEDSALIDAGIERARGLVACLSNDKDNLYITVSAKNLNPWIQVVARAVAIEMKSKLERVGADSVVSPNQIGGMRMASEMLRPHVVSFLDKMLRAKDQSVRVGEVTIQQGSSLDGKMLKDARITEKTGLVVITVLPPDSEEYVYNPTADYVLKSRTVVIVIGDMESIKKLKKMAAS